MYNQLKLSTACKECLKICTYIVFAFWKCIPSKKYSFTYFYRQNVLQPTIKYFKKFCKFLRIVNHLFRFESLTLSHNNMIALKPVLLAWLEEAEAARRDPEGAGGLLPAGEKKRDEINHR